MKWSTYQTNIFNDVQHGSGNTIVKALAGSGKTSTLIESLNYVPKNSNWLLVAFNKKIADELTARAPLGGETCTLHKLGLKSIGRTYKNVSVDKDKVDSILNIALKDQKHNRELKYAISRGVSLAKSYLAHTSDEIEDVLDEHDLVPDDIERQEFINHILFTLDICKRKPNIVDFDDMVWFPNVLKLDVPKYDWIFVDEAQDLNKTQIEFVLKLRKPTSRVFVFGDQNQCVEKNSLVTFSDGQKKIEDVKIGDKILSYENSNLIFKEVLNKSRSEHDNAIKITTTSGKEQICSLKHKLYFSIPELKNTEHIVYLMYRPDLGFRVGKTNMTWKKGAQSFGQRAVSERAERLWILSIEKNNEDALFVEESISLKYGVPTMVFNAEQRGLNQIRVNRIFDDFGQNGYKVLDDFCYEFNYPHWMQRSFSKKNISIKNRNTVHLVAHSKKGASQVSVEWSNDSFTKEIQEAGISYTKAKKGFRIRKYCKNYIDALNFANEICNKTSAILEETLSGFKEKVILGPAVGIFPGGCLPVKTSNGVQLEKIEKVEKISGGTFYDLEIENTGNFISNDILNHNCIYMFRGADSNAMNRFQQALKAKSLPLSISYRCPISVVKQAQRLVPELEAAPNAAEGQVREISHSEMLQLAKPGCFIISRLNAPLISLALGFIKKGVPCNIQGKDLGENLSSLVKRSRTKTIEKFVVYVEKWKKKESERLIARNKSTELIQDKADCLFALTENCSSIQELKDKIGKLFADTDDSKKIILTNCHRCKGLERNDVFMLLSTFRYNTQEEKNLVYVATTRAKQNLFLIRTKKMEREHSRRQKEEAEE